MNKKGLLFGKAASESWVLPITINLGLVMIFLGLIKYESLVFPGITICFIVGCFYLILSFFAIFKKEPYPKNVIPINSKPKSSKKL